MIIDIPYTARRIIDLDPIGPNHEPGESGLYLQNLGLGKLTAFTQRDQFSVGHFTQFIIIPVFIVGMIHIGGQDIYVFRTREKMTI
jgi:hypothetical protein